MSQLAAPWLDRVLYARRDVVVQEAVLRISSMSPETTVSRSVYTK